MVKQFVMQITRPYEKHHFQGDFHFDEGDKYNV